MTNPPATGIVIVIGQMGSAAAPPGLIDFATETPAFALKSRTFINNPGGYSIVVGHTLYNGGAVTENLTFTDPGGNNIAQSGYLKLT